MKTRTRIIAIAGLAVVGAAATAGAVTAATESENETPITGADLDRASRTALDHTGGGRVTETEVGDEDSYYEVEVTLADGSQVDVQLAEDFSVVKTMKDSESESSGD